MTRKIRIRTLEETILDGRYLVSRWMENGGFSQIYQGSDLETDEKIIIKCPQTPSNQKNVDIIVDEAFMLFGIQHPGIIRSKDLVFDHGQPNLILEYLEFSLND